MEERYWNMMTQKKYAEFYLGCHLHKCVKIERWMNIVIAIISTGSLAGLFASNSWKMIWAILLVITQALTAARPYFPYERRIRELEKGIPLLHMVYEEIEKEWNSISRGFYDEDIINELYYDFVRRWDEVNADILKGDVLPRNKEFEISADIENNKYFNNMFGG